MISQTNTSQYLSLGTWELLYLKYISHFIDGCGGHNSSEGAIGTEKEEYHWGVFEYHDSAELKRLVRLFLSVVPDGARVQGPIEVRQLEEPWWYEEEADTNSRRASLRSVHEIECTSQESESKSLLLPRGRKVLPGGTFWMQDCLGDIFDEVWDRHFAKVELLSSDIVLRQHQPPTSFVSVVEQLSYLDFCKYFEPSPDWRRYLFASSDEAARLASEPFCYTYFENKQGQSSPHLVQRIMNIHDGDMNLLRQYAVFWKFPLSNGQTTQWALLHFYHEDEFGEGNVINDIGFRIVSDDEIKDYGLMDF